MLEDAGRKFKKRGGGLLCICGDSRISSLVVTNIETVADSVPKIVILDIASPNTHGKELIEFVRDVGMVVRNGKGSSNNDSHWHKWFLSG